MPKSMAKKKESNFKKAVDATPDVAGKSLPGLSALGTHSQKVIVPKEKVVNGSLEIDEATKKLYPNYNRWDYVLSVNDKCYFVEVHSANTGEVSTVLRKLVWLKTWLQTRAPLIDALKASHVTPYYWVQSAGCDIPKHTRQYKLAAKEGLLPVGHLRIK